MTMLNRQLNIYIYIWVKEISAEDIHLSIMVCQRLNLGLRKKCPENKEQRKKT